MHVTITIDFPDLSLSDAQADEAEMNTFWHRPIHDFAARFNSHAEPIYRRTWGMMKPFGSTITLTDPTPQGENQ